MVAIRGTLGKPVRGGSGGSQLGNWNNWTQSNSSENCRFLQGTASKRFLETDRDSAVSESTTDIESVSSGLRTARTALRSWITTDV